MRPEAFVHDPERLAHDPALPSAAAFPPVKAHNDSFAKNFRYAEMSMLRSVRACFVLALLSETSLSLAP